MWNRPGSQYAPNAEQVAWVESHIAPLRDLALSLAVEPIPLHDLLVRMSEAESDRAYVSRALTELQGRGLLNVSPMRIATAA